MSKSVVNENCQFQVSDGDLDATFTFASKAKADGGKIAVGQIVCSISNSSAGGADKNASGSATIMASSVNMKCDSQAVLLEGDEIDVTVTGMTKPQPIPLPTIGTVHVKIIDAGQSKVKGT